MGEHRQVEEAGDVDLHAFVGARRAWLLQHDAHLLRRAGGMFEHEDGIIWCPCGHWHLDLPPVVDNAKWEG